MNAKHNRIICDLILGDNYMRLLLRAKYSLIYFLNK